MTNNDEQEMKEVIMGMLKAIAGLTAKVLELEQSMKNAGFYKVKSNEELIEKKRG
jgi:hypothetical protein